MKPHYWFVDYEAISCAAWRVEHRLPLYDMHGACPAGMEGAVYVYPPFVARTFAWLDVTMGQTAQIALYGFVFWLAAAFLLWSASFSARTPGTLRERAPFLALIQGNVFFWGNVATVAHGAVTATAVLMAERPLILAFVIAGVGAIKPAYLTYVAALLYAARPVRERAGLVAIALAAGLAPTIAFLATGGAQAQQWLSFLHYFVLTQQPGVGFISWAGAVGADLDSLWFKLAYLVYAATLTLAGLVIAERGELSPIRRVWLGLGVAALLNPRVISYDLLSLGPGLLAGLEATRALSQTAHKQYRRLFVTICIVSEILTFAGGTAWVQVATFAFAAALIAIGGQLLMQRSRASGVAEFAEATRSKSGLRIGGPR